MSEQATLADITSAGEASDGTSTGGEHAFLVVYAGPETSDRTRVIELPDGVEVTFGRSRGCTVHVDTERVSRTHARVTRRGAEIVVEDLGSRNGTRVNGTKIDAPTRVSLGDEIGVGPSTAVVGLSTRMRKRPRVGSLSDFEERIGAEVDRVVRYRRPLGLIMLRLDGSVAATEAALTRVPTVLRRMDVLAEYGPDEFAILLPEANRASAEAAARRIVREGRVAALPYGGVGAHVGLSVSPEDGVQVGELISRARTALRAARTGAGDDGVSGAPQEDRPDSEEVISLDPQMKRVFSLVRKVADTGITVLVLGETGAGKEVVAEALHRASSRVAKPFVKLNCASLPETLLESELFGYEKGAFTGADKRKLGYFEASEGGTLFLDEIGEMPLGVQAKLLRILEERKLVRVGGTTAIPVDVRVVCATNRDLEDEVRRGRFREDLYFRVSAFTVLVPSLRDRKSEIRPLAEHFARKFGRDLKQAPPALSPGALAILETYAWPGNVRELRNAIERAVVLQTTGTIEPMDLPERVIEGGTQHGGSGGGETGAASAAGGANMRAVVASTERAAIVAALEACDGNQTHAARRLGLSRRALIYKLEKYGLKPPPGSAE